MKHKRVERLWRKEGLGVPRKQPKRGRHWLAEGAIVRRRAERPNDVCSYDFVFERTAAGRALKHLVVVDEYRRACLAIVVARRLPPTSALTTAPSSPPRRCLTGSSAWACRRSSSSLAAPGRMAPSSRLTASSGTSASTVSASTRCSRRRYSASSGASRTTTSGPPPPSATVRLHHRLDQLFASPSCRWRYQSYPQKWYNAWGHVSSDRPLDDGVSLRSAEGVTMGTTPSAGTT